MSHLLLLNGPNLNLLGSREPGIYGMATLPEIEASLAAEAGSLGHQIDSFQSNHEGALIDRVHQAGAAGIDFAIFNPGGFTHTSVALRDAFLSVSLPFIEVHLSNIHAREAFRHHSYFSDIASGIIVGMGPLGYRLALTAVHDLLQAKGD